MYIIRAQYNNKTQYWCGSGKGFWSGEKLLAKQYSTLSGAQAKKSCLIHKFLFINKDNIFIDLTA